MGISRTRKYAPRKPRKERSLTVTIASLAVLALAAVGLSGVALLSQDNGDSLAGGGVSATTASADAGGDASPDNDAPATDETADSGLASVEVADRILAVSDDPDRLLRAEGIECGAGTPQVEVSADGGGTWNPADLSTLEISGVRQLQFGEAGRAQLAFVDGQCGLQFARSYVYGGAWEAGPGAGGIWTLGTDADEGEAVVSGQEVDAPCTVVGISGANDIGIVLCDDATVAVSEDGGQTWGDTVAVPGARAVASDGESFDVITTETDDCAGVAARPFDGSELGELGDCADTDAVQDQIAASTGGGSLYVWTGDDMLRSDDRGSTWG